mgnify:CR=1 FL=1|tara:strand:+ start:233 stop:2308 length:2076 start_codon:yes stop_codon:yes gene_type:complete
MAEPTKIDKENFESVINTLKQQHQERASEDKVNTETIVTSVKESAKTQNRSFGQSLSRQFGKSISVQEDALKKQQAVLDEAERQRLLEEGQKQEEAVDGKDLGTGVFAKSLSGLKALVGGVAIFFLGILAVLKAFQNKEFRDATKDLFDAIKQLFVFIKDELFPVIMPVLTTILTYTVKGLTKGFELVLDTFKLLKDFGENGPKPEEYKGLPALGIGLAALFNNLMDPKTGIIGRFIRRVKISLELGTRSITRFFTGGKGLSLFGETGLITKLKGLFKPVTDLAKTLTKLPVISSFTSFFSKTGGFLKMLGKLFFPFTIVIAAFDTIKGIIDGVLGAEGETQVGPAGMTTQKPPSFMDKLMGGIKGGLKGLVNSLVGMPLDFLKNAVAWVLGKFGFTGAEESLKEFSFVETFNSIFDAIFNPIDTIKTLVQNLAEKLNIPSFEEMKKKLNDFRKKIFSTSGESESGRPEIFGFAIPELPSISGMFDKLLELRNKVYNPETGEIFGMTLPSLPTFKLPNFSDIFMNAIGGLLPKPDGYLGWIYKFLPDELKQAAQAFAEGGSFKDGTFSMGEQETPVEVKKAMGLTDQGDVPTMTREQLAAIIDEMERDADTAGNLDNFDEEARLMARVEELSALHDAMIRDNVNQVPVTVVQGGNTTSVSNQSQTYSTAKSSTPPDSTFNYMSYRNSFGTP